MLYNTCHNMNMMYRRKQQNGKVVIVDYDDTILPSTFVDRWQIENSKVLPQHVSCDWICIVILFARVHFIWCWLR